MPWKNGPPPFLWSHEPDRRVQNAFREPGWKAAQWHRTRAAAAGELRPPPQPSSKHARNMESICICSQERLSDAVQTLRLPPSDICRSWAPSPHTRLNPKTEVGRTVQPKRSLATTHTRRANRGMKAIQHSVKAIDSATNNEDTPVGVSSHLREGRVVVLPSVGPLLPALPRRKPGLFRRWRPCPLLRHQPAPLLHMRGAGDRFSLPAKSQIHDWKGSIFCSGEIWELVYKELLTMVFIPATRRKPISQP